MKMLKGTKGFTLVELIIVLAVIAIILGVVIPAIRGMQEEANLTRSEQELHTLETAVMSYFRHNAAYPAGITTDLTGASPKIVENVLDDPFDTDATNDTYGYITGNDAEFGDYYILYTRGPDATGETSWNATTDQVDTGGDDIVVSNGFINVQ